ncbi:unnamed protein product [Mytilus coruscus]|uniref:CCHC-type domain-containing protein n=1 Tax=Mytilus coruscus TaxID=42192 RepID=A0A6J8B1S6_MYTCO|nr:unnamed protein product [Mytilus coruscus]
MQTIDKSIPRKIFLQGQLVSIRYDDQPRDPKCFKCGIYGHIARDNCQNENRNENKGDGKTNRFDTNKKYSGEAFPSPNENNTKEHERENSDNDFGVDQQNIDKLLSENVNKHIILEHEESIIIEDPLFIENDLNIGQEIEIQNDKLNINEIETETKNETAEASCSEVFAKLDNSREKSLKEKNPEEINANGSE